MATSGISSLSRTRAYAETKENGSLIRPDVRRQSFFNGDLGHFEALTPTNLRRNEGKGKLDAAWRRGLCSVYLRTRDKYSRYREIALKSGSFPSVRRQSWYSWFLDEAPAELIPRGTRSVQMDRLRRTAVDHAKRGPGAMPTLPATPVSAAQSASLSTRGSASATVAAASKKKNHLRISQAHAVVNPLTLLAKWETRPHCRRRKWNLPWPPGPVASEYTRTGSIGSRPRIECEPTPSSVLDHRRKLPRT